MNKTLPISVILSTYFKVDPVWLHDAVCSLVKQTMPPNEIIVVIDGPVSDLQRDVLDYFKKNFNQIVFKFIDSKINSGLAASMNIALKHVTNSWVARMDSDDISRLDRFEIQYKVAIANSFDVICSWHSEFIDDISCVHAIKKTPQSNSQILKALNFRNIISHPSILLKTDVLKGLGGYDVNVGFLEDYDLYLKLAASGAIFHAIQEPLVFVRVSRGQIERRGGFSYTVNELKFRWRAFIKRRISFSGFIVGIFIYPVFRLLPVNFKNLLYKLVRTTS